MSKTEASHLDSMPGLDWKSQEILRALYENGKRANTTELRSLTGIDDNAVILYRHNEKLAPAGLITLEQPRSEGTDIPPKIATLTSKGESVAERIIERQGDQSTTSGDYVEQLEAKINRLEARIDELEADTRRSEEQAALAETVEHITTSTYGGWSDEGTQQFTEVFCGMLALRDYLLEHSDLTRDELDERMAKAQTALETADQ